MLRPQHRHRGQHRRATRPPPVHWQRRRMRNISPPVLQPWEPPLQHRPIPTLPTPAHSHLMTRCATIARVMAGRRDSEIVDLVRLAGEAITPIYPLLECSTPASHWQPISVTSPLRCRRPSFRETLAVSFFVLTGQRPTFTTSSLIRVETFISKSTLINSVLPA